MDPTKRFSDRAQNYTKYRPNYPQAILTHLQQRCGVTSTAVIADIGSGTGKLTQLLLTNGNLVYGVEPNKEMRTVAEHFLRQYAHFTSVAGTAEATTLNDQSVDCITAGQSFHWFDHDRAKQEFKRILRPNGTVALIWNERDERTDPMAAYEQLIGKFTHHYHEVTHKDSEATIGRFFDGRWQEFNCDNEQIFDFEGVKGRLLSSSYAPLAGHPNHEPLIAALCRWFETYQENGQIHFTYKTRIYYGKLK